LVRVAPQTPQEIIVVAREKMTHSLEQSRQDTFRKLLAIIFTSVVDEFELLSTLTWSVVCFAGLGAAE
jgi:hypothetical protein